MTDKYDQLINEFQAENDRFKASNNFIESKYNSIDNAVTEAKLAENGSREAEESAKLAASEAAEKAANETAQKVGLLCPVNSGNWSTVAGQEITEQDRLKGYEYPDDSGNEYAVRGSVTLPITRPSTPEGDDRFYLASAVNIEKMRSESASQLGLIYQSEWSQGLTIPANSKTNKYGWWQGDIGKFITPLSDVSFVTEVSWSLDSKNWEEVRSGVGAYQTPEEYNCVGDGIVNDTANFQTTDSNAHKYVARKTYLLENENLPNIKNLIAENDFQANNSIYDGIITIDEVTEKTVGLQQNHLQSVDVVTQITIGNITTPPLWEAEKQNNYMCIAHWYQDFGLEYVRVNQPSAGWIGWYTWQWLFYGATGDGHQEKRMPLLGYYRGDDANVLDWQCYWLNYAGVSGVSLSNRGKYLSITDTWNQSSDANYWIYQLLNNTKNSKMLTYNLWADSTSPANTPENRANIEASFDAIIDVYKLHQNYTTISKNGKTYAVIFAYEFAQWRGAYDNYSGDTNTRDFLERMAQKIASNLSVSGLAILARNPWDPFVGDARLESEGVLVFDTEYSSTRYNPAYNGGKDPAVTYGDLAVGVSPWDINDPTKSRFTLPNICTDLESHSAHPSNFTFAGSTPELFEVMTLNCIKRMPVNETPNIITVGNVSEWAEQGAALQPNQRDGWGYLNALKSALLHKPADVSEITIFKSQGNTFLSAPTVPLTVTQYDTTLCPVTLSYSWTSTATPFIVDYLAYDGKQIRVRNDSAFNLTLNGESVLVGSGMLLDGGVVILSNGQSIDLEYRSSSQKWVQISQKLAVS